MFTKRHYVSIAKVIKAEKGIVDEEIDRLFITDALATMFAEDNKDFDSKKFYKVCDVSPLPIGVEEQKIKENKNVRV